MPEAVIAAAVIVRDSRVLLVRRRVAEGSLSWQLPAGKVEPGETVQEAAVREARDEAGVMSGASHVARRAGAPGHGPPRDLRGL